jgi:alpha,alpha-trehalase
MRYLALLFLCAAAFAAPAPSPQPPSVIYGELFDAVQRARIFADSKTFADALPRQSPDSIMAAWRGSHGQAGFDLREFVAQHFSEPATPASGYRSQEGQDVCAHIEALWPVLTRTPDEEVAGSSLLPLPHRYVVPGGRFREIYYWDSYFTLQGLDAHRDLALDMLANFAHLIDRYGHIPNGNRTYYLSRSQPPFFAAMVAHLAAGGHDQLYAQYLPQLLREHAFWMEGAERLAPGAAHRRVVRLRSGEILNRYWDDRAMPRDEAWREDLETAAKSRRPATEVYRSLRAAAESGWDFSSRWLADGRTLATIHTVDFLPVDLNSLMAEMERVIARGSP